MNKSLILFTNIFKNVALFACFVDFYVLYYMYMTKYNVTYTVYFDNDIKNIDTAIMANNENEAIEFSKKKLEKYLSKRNFDGFELDNIVEYDNTFHSVKLNGFNEYKPA